jgi:hypothetical protein
MYKQAEREEEAIVKVKYPRLSYGRAWFHESEQKHFSRSQAHSEGSRGCAKVNASDQAESALEGERQHMQ